jgi:hypothetical protein
MYNKKMFATSKTLTSNVKNIISNLVFKGFSQAKKVPIKGNGALNGSLAAETQKSTINNMTQNISFGITQAKHVSEISHEVVVEAHLKRI